MARLIGRRVVFSAACIMWCLLIGLGMALLVHDRKNNSCIAGAILGSVLLGPMSIVCWFLAIKPALKHWWRWLNGRGYWDE